MTLRARSAFFAISRLAYALSAYARTTINEAFRFTQNMYQTFTKTSSFKDFSRQMLADLRSRLSFLEEVARNLTRYVVDSAPLKWLVSRRESILSSDNSLTKVHSMYCMCLACVFSADWSWVRSDVVNIYNLAHRPASSVYGPHRVKHSFPPPHFEFWFNFSFVIL